MAADLRVAADLSDHPKTILLIRRTSERAFRALVRLWGWACDNRPDGNLAGMDSDEIAAAAHWPEDQDAERFVSALASVRFLDGAPGTYALHDWQEHQPWIQRREQLRRDAIEFNDRRWGARDESGERSPTRKPNRSPLRSPTRKPLSSQPNPIEQEQAAVAAVPAREARDTATDDGGEHSPEQVVPAKARTAGRKAAEPRPLSADRRITLNMETWSLDGIADADVAALAAEFPLVDVRWAAQDVAGYARVDERYRGHKNWARTWRNRCRQLQDRAERGLDAGPRPRMSPEPAATNEPPAPLPPLTPPSRDWPRVAATLRARLPADQFDQWIAPLRYVGDRGDCLELEVSGEFESGWVRDNYGQTIRDACRDALGVLCGLRVVAAGGEA